MYVTIERERSPWPGEICDSPPSCRLLHSFFHLIWNWENKIEKPSEYQTPQKHLTFQTLFLVRFSNGLLTWLGGSFKYQQILYNLKQTTIQKPDHWTTRHFWTIQIPDLSGIQMVTLCFCVVNGVSCTSRQQKNLFWRKQLILLLWDHYVWSSHKR